MFLIPHRRASTRYAIKPMNCPGHMLLFGSQLRSYRDLPLRYAEAAPLHRNELAGALHGLTRVRYVTQDDAHIFCTREQIDSELDGTLDYLRYLYGLFGIEPRAELSTRPDNKLGTDEEWDFTEGELVARARAARDRVLRRRGGGLVLRAEDRPAHDRRARPLLAARHDPARRADAGALRPHLHGRRTTRSTPCSSSTARSSARSSASSASSIEHYAGAFPFWLAPVQVRLIPVGETHRAAVARALRERLAGRRLPRRSRRARRDARQAHPRRRGREGPVHDRLGRPRVRRVARRTRARAAAQSTRSLEELLAEFRSTACYSLPLKVGADHAPHLRSHEPAGVQPSRLDEEKWPLLAAVFVVDRKEDSSLVKGL